VAGNGTYASAGTVARLPNAPRWLPVWWNVPGGELLLGWTPLETSTSRTPATVGIRKVSNGLITTWRGTGPSGFSGDNGPAPASIEKPSGVAVDSAGNVYIETMSRRPVWL